MNAIRRMSGFLMALSIVMLCASGCGSSAPEVETVEVPVTVVVRETVIVPQTVVVKETVIATPESTATKPASASDDETMAAALSVELRGLRIVPMDTNAWRFSDEAHFEFWYKNTGTVGIRAFTGAVILADLFDRPMRTIRITHDEPLAPGEERTDNSLMYELNQFMDEDTWVKTTDFEDMNTSFRIDSVLFVDGTKLGSVD